MSKVKFIFIFREWIIENKGCPFCKTPIIPEDTNTIPRINNLNNDMINDNQINFENNNIFQNDANTHTGNLNDKNISSGNNKAENINVIINPFLEKIKVYKETLKSKINLENSILGSQDIYNENKHLSNFSSGAVEYGLPCEVIYSRNLEVKYLIRLINHRMKLKDLRLNITTEN